MVETFFTAMFIATVILLAITRLEVSRLIRHHYLQKVSFFTSHPIQPGDTVMLGDSLTDGARWDELFPGAGIKNRGINADTVNGVLARLEDVINGKPARIFILIGTNDLQWYEYRSDRAILDGYERILRRIRMQLPGTQIFVQSLLPRRRMYARRIKTINRQLRVLAGKYGCVYIDLHSAFEDGHGALRRELTNDNLHLLGDGYLIWKGKIREYIEK